MGEQPNWERAALGSNNQALGSPGRSLCLTKSSACGRLWQFAHPRPLSLLHVTPGSPEGNTEGPGTASSEPLLPS